MKFIIDNDDKEEIIKAHLEINELSGNLELYLNNRALLGITTDGKLRRYSDGRQYIDNIQWTNHGLIELANFYRDDE